MVLLEPGMRLRSAVCETEVMVVAAPKAEVELTCGGESMLDIGSEPPTAGALAAPDEPGTLLGKRYAGKGGVLELLCTRPGAGSLRVSGALLQVKGAKPLPSSD